MGKLAATKGECRGIAERHIQTASDEGLPSRDPA